MSLPVDDSEVGISPGFYAAVPHWAQSREEEEVRLSGPGRFPATDRWCSRSARGAQAGVEGMSRAPSVVYPNFLLCRRESAPCKMGSIVLTRAASSLGALWVAGPHPSLQGIYWKCRWLDKGPAYFCLEPCSQSEEHFFQFTRPLCARIGDHVLQPCLSLLRSH